VILNRLENSVYIHEIASSDKEETLSFTYPKEHLGQGGLRSDVKGDAVFVTGKRLDDFFDGNFVADFIKIDVEGMEFNSIFGMKRIIEESRDVILAVEKNTIIDDPSEMYWNLLNSLGLEMYALPLSNSPLGAKFGNLDFANFTGTYFATRQSNLHKFFN
jgi:hypothetical protein